MVCLGRDGGGAGKHCGAGSWVMLPHPYPPNRGSSRARRILRVAPHSHRTNPVRRAG